MGSAALTSHEVRVGVAYAYVQLCRALGASWLARNYTHLLAHFAAFLQLPALAKAGFSYPGMLVGPLLVPGPGPKPGPMPRISGAGPASALIAIFSTSILPSLCYDYRADSDI